jgi:hypothetical protein
MAKSRMKAVQTPKRLENVLTIETPKNVSKGHQPHRSGAGRHKDRRLSRQRTRQAARRSALAFQ